MLIIKGANGKSLVLAEHFIGTNTLIVESSDLTLSKFIQDEDANLLFTQLPSNSVENQDKIIKALTSFYEKEGKELGYVNIIFYLNVDETRIEAFKEFEKQFKLEDYDFIRIILTVQADNEELEYYDY